MKCFCVVRLDLDGAPRAAQGFDSFMTRYRAQDLTLHVSGISQARRKETLIRFLSQARSPEFQVDFFLCGQGENGRR